MKAKQFILLMCLSVLSIDVATQSNTTAESINELYLQQLLDNMDTSADPCDDFYQYACGNWAQRYISKEYLDMPGYMDHKVNKQLLQAIKTHRNESGVYEKVWNYYAACTNVTAPALNTFLRLVQAELHFEWPILRENWPKPWPNATQFDWLSVLAALRGYGLNGVFISENVNTRLTNGSHFLIELHEQLPHLPLRQKEVEEIFINFGLPAAASRNVTAKVLELEEFMKKLIAVDNETLAEDVLAEKRNFTRLEMNVEDLKELVPQIAWQAYFEKLLPNAIKIETQTLLLYAYSLEYFRNLPAVLKKYSNETIAYYIMLKFMYHLNRDLPTEKDKSPRCIQHLRGYMTVAINYIYQQNFYSTHENATNTALYNIYNKLRAKFEQLVQENNLKLDETERAFILTELHSMQLQIGNLPQQSTQLKQFVESYYQNITLNASDFYHNHLQLIKLNNYRQQLQLANTPIPAAEQIFEQDTESASSSSPVKIFFNAILVPYGYLQLPFFHHQLHPILQHSLFGFILAHEIIHAYDLFHIVYDQHGNYNELGIGVAQHFWPYMNCSAQSELNVVLSENMADITGLRLAYQTYFDEVERTSAGNDIVSRSNFTSAQLFFVNSVQFLCANMAKIGETGVDAAYLGHDMHNVRVQRNWANLEQFAVAFQCANGSKMHPAEKCRLW